jgi:hypothetical protein
VCVLYINKGKGVKRGEKEETMDGVALSLSLSLWMLELLSCRGAGHCLEKACTRSSCFTDEASLKWTRPHAHECRLYGRKLRDISVTVLHDEVPNIKILHVSPPPNKKEIRG